ncbi:hypothetical protein [Streptomyces sp. NRRL S-350]|uniref:hypothetical protein n=1 Tax=Streptomyces sp. NRRL S-350 TaxID=1463902 RepID=UPI0004C29319|nr:hypothetical protein [Streptomyces sp. NRRL S-350]
MTVLHSRNADAADPVDVADAADVKDSQDAAAEPDLREDLGRYAELGAFTLSADTHAWYAAVDTVATPEDARAASTALAELRGHDLQQTWEAVTALAAEVKLDEPDTVAKTALLVEMLHRVHRTSATLAAAAYDADLGALAAATADSAWRRENGVKLSWLRARSLRKQATALATDRRIRREDLHEALASAEIERRAWAALAPAGTLPVVPADGALVERTAQAFEAINTGLNGLARLLPDHDLEALPFAELIDLVERLASDEGTLYRLPTIRSLRSTLEEAGLGDLLAELATAKADRRAAEAAYAARQALAGGQRDRLTAEAAADETVVEASVETPVESTVGEELAVEEPETEERAAEGSGAELSDAEAEAAARQALAGGQRDGLVEEAPEAAAAPAEEAVETEPAAETEAAVETEVAAATEAEVAVEAETESDAEPDIVAGAEDEAVPGADADTSDDEPTALEDELTEEAPAAVVTLPAPSPAADDLVATATAAPADAAADAAADATVADEAAGESAEAAVEVEAPAAEEEVAETAVVAETPAAEADEAAEVDEAATATVEAEPVAEESADEPVADEPVAEAGAVAVEAAEPAAEPAVEAEAPAVEAEAPAVEPEAAVVTAVVEEKEAEPEAAVDTPAPAAEPAAEPAADFPARPAKPDFTPGRPVTAYSPEELLAVVRWLDGDGVERTDEELLRAAMKEFGFARLGPRIKEALGTAVAAARG